MVQELEGWECRYCKLRMVADKLWCGGCGRTVGEQRGGVLLTTVLLCVCDRCGYVWHPNRRTQDKGKLPKKCADAAHCGSRWWNRGRAGLAHEPVNVK